MGRRSALVVVVALLLALALAQDVPAASIPAAAAAALDADEECPAGSGAAGCALSALQLRAQKQHQEEEAEEAYESGPAALAQAGESPAEPEQPRNASLLETSSVSAKCFSFTGGTCATEQCAPFRHATCQSGQCVCSGCAGADGACHHEQNRLVAKGVLLRNSKYHHYKMYFQRVSGFGQMKTTRASSWMNMEQDRFDIYEVPGTDHGHKEYFLASAKWPDYVLGMKATTGTALSPFAAYAVNLGNKGGILDVWGTSNIMLRLCETADGGVNIGAKMGDTKSVWAYVHHGSWLVYGSLTGLGSGAVWKLDPAPPSGTFPPCGPR